MTIKEIATQAGVSIATVDRVIHERGYVSNEKRKLIKNIIENTNFKPNVFASNLKLNTNCVAGVLLPLLSSEFGYWNLIYQGVFRATEELRSRFFSVKLFEYDRNVAGSFTQAAERMIAEGIEACAIVPKSPEEIRAFLAKHPQLVYVLLDSLLPNAAPLSIIYSNPFRGGELGGKIMSLFKQNPHVLCTVRMFNSFTSIERIRGFKSYFAHNPNIVMHDLIFDTLTEIPETLKALYDKYGSIDGVFVSCSAAHILGNEIALMGKKEKTIIVGYDLVQGNSIAIKSDTVDCIFSQRPLYQGYSGMYQLFKHLILQQKTDYFIDIPADIIFKENLPADFDSSALNVMNPYVMKIR